MADIEDAQAKVTAAAAETKAKAEAAFASANELGFFSHFSEYNLELINPAQKLMADQSLMSAPTIKEKGLYMFEKAKAEVMGHVTFDPPTPKESFQLYNVLGFWLGVLESVFFALFGHGLISLAWNGAVGYAIAYTLYWTMTCCNIQKIQFYAMVFIALYIGFNVYMGISTLIYVLPSALYFSKAFCDCLMFINGYKMYKAIAGDSLLPKEMF